MVMHFPIIPLENIMVKKLRSHNMNVLNSNLCYNKVCYKGTAQHLKEPSLRELF